MSDTTIDISIVLPNYNHAQFLPIAIDAILSQSKTLKTELIFIDDASKDNSIEIVTALKEKHPQIRMICFEKNSGPVVALNRGIEEALGEYVILAAADDKMLPGLLEESYDLLKKHPAAGLCTSNFCYFNDGNESELYEMCYPSLQESGFISSQKLQELIKQKNFWIPGGPALMRKKAVLDAGLLKLDLRAICDWFMCHVIGFRSGICYLPKPLTTFRVSSQNYSTSVSQKVMYDPLYRYLDSEEYRDVRDQFFKSGILSQLQSEIIPYLIKKRHYRKHALEIFIDKFKRKFITNTRQIRKVTLSD